MLVDTIECVITFSFFEIYFMFWINTSQYVEYSKFIVIVNYCIIEHITIYAKKLLYFVYLIVLESLLGNIWSPSSLFLWVSQESLKELYLKLIYQEYFWNFRKFSKQFFSSFLHDAISDNWNIHCQ